MRKITFISDTHGQHQDPDIFPDAGEGWMLVHAGDCGNHGCRDEVENFLNWFSAQKYQHKVMIAGNHDYALSRGCTIPRNITYLEDRLAVIDGVRIYGTPWTRRYSDMVFELQRGEELDRVWRKIPSGLDLLITHSPPYGILDECRENEHVGCEQLLERIRQVRPRIHVFGHVHKQGMTTIDGTVHINASLVTQEVYPLCSPVSLDYDTLLAWTTNN